MNYKTFPRTNVVVSEIGFGVWSVTTNWWGKVDEKEGIHWMQKAFDLGITFFDTADTYGKGYGETIMPKAFKGKRDKIQIGSKFGYEWEKHADRPGNAQTELPQNFSPAFVKKACEGALKRMETDYIDLWQVHNPKMALLTDELFKTLEDLKQEGKIKAYGVALGPAIGWEEEGLVSMERWNVHSCQTVYNLLEQDPGRSLIKMAEKTQTGLMSRVPHSSGVLQGLKPNFNPNDHRSHRKLQWFAEGEKKVEKLQFLLEGGKRTLGQLALEYIISQPTMVAVLPTITSEKELDEFAACGGCYLTVEEMARVKDLYEHNFYIESENEPAVAK